MGSGLLMTVSVLYFNRIVGLSIAQVGLGLTVAGLLSAVPMGHPADRRGPRMLFVALSLMVSGLSLLYLARADFWQFLVVAVLLTVIDRGAGAIRAALIAVAALNAGMSIQYAVLDVAIPLWVVDHTDAPRWTVALF